MAGAIFDSILVYIVNKVSPNHWQGLRKEVCDALNLKKTDHTLGIIATTYVHSHIICLQEVAKEFITTAQNDARLQHFVVVTPPELGKRDQNSVVLLNGNMFDAATIETGLTADVWTALTDAGGKVPVATGAYSPSSLFFLFFFVIFSLPPCRFSFCFCMYFLSCYIRVLSLPHTILALTHSCILFFSFIPTLHSFFTITPLTHLPSLTMTHTQHATLAR